MTLCRFRRTLIALLAITTIGSDAFADSNLAAAGAPIELLPGNGSQSIALGRDFQITAPAPGWDLSAWDAFSR